MQASRYGQRSIICREGVRVIATAAPILKFTKLEMLTKLSKEKAMVLSDTPILNSYCSL